ncbi:ubiquitin carboxyl-terminal hydrolase 20-like [Capsicum annuum]|uniref:ubiquitin carboxyl-terminal hydrolase 20-like n=1 Tax=Capsicum annuum TaxID=4072 RepID=UPI001FB08B63|nr:ubiquitin carboxyl-terminal hydrolase 20-like [Capsicum annuum]
MDLEWFADDWPIDDKPTASIEPKYDFEVNTIVEPKYDIEVKPIRSLEAKCDSEAYPISSVGPKCNFEAEPIALVGPKCDFEAKPIKSLDPKCDFAREKEEKRLVWTSNVLKTYKGAGLLNLGNTCFLNAVLQCFMNIVPLFDLLLHKAHVVPCDHFCLICIFKELIGLSLVYEAYEGRSVSPWRLVENLICILTRFVVLKVVKISDFTSGFHKYEKEDAHEFLQCFLNRLESRCSDIVQQVFCVCLVSKFCCCNCGHYSNTYVPLIDLSLEIKDVDNLHSALESFTRVEKLDDPEIKFSCEICNVQVSIEKQLMLYNVPTISIFHLKRFQNNGSVERKVDKHVSFLLELDLLFYTDNNQTINEQIKYDLYAVIVHAGSISISGHYYCFICAEPNEWYKFGDSMISRVHEDLVLAEEAYIMFYTKRDTLWFSDFVALQKHNVDTIPKLSFSLSNHHASDIVDNELKKTVQTFTPGPPSAINSSKENNASQDIGVFERMAPLLPKSPSKSQSTVGKLIFNFYLLNVTPTNCFVCNIGRSGF